MKNIFWLLSILLSFDSLYAQSEIKILYTDWLIETFDNRFTIDQILIEKGIRSVEKTIIKDSSSVIAIRNELNKSVDTININICDDYRLALIIPNDDGHIDTLAFGECFVMLHNDVFKKVNRKILKIVIPYLKNNYRSDFYFYLKELDKLYGKE